MSRKSVNFGDKKTNKSNFYKNKKLFKIGDIGVNKILIWEKEPYGAKESFRYFIGYDYNDVVRPLCIKLPQMIGYVKCFDRTKIMSFNISDKELLKKYTKILKKVPVLMNMKLDSEPVYGNNHPQTLLGECKYETKKNKIENLINDNFDSSSSDESDSESHNELDSESGKPSKKSEKQ